MILVNSLALLLVAAIGVVTFSRVYNKRIISELEANPEGEKAARVMLISFPDGYRIPVNYLREGATVFAGSDFGWWKRIANEGTEVNLLVKGESLEGLATVSADETYTYGVFERLRPDAPTWASRLVGAKLIIIDIADKKT